MVLKEKRKRGFVSRRRLLVLAFVSGLSLLVGIFGTLLLVPPKEVPYAINGVIVDTTPTGVFYAVFATEDIACGDLILPHMVIETVPEQIAVRGYYPNQPVWQGYHYPQLASLYESVARYDLPRGTRINPLAVAPQDETIICPTVVP